MPINLRERFGPKAPLPRALLAEDFVFSPAELEPLRDFRIERQSVAMLDAPVAVTRRYVLSRGMEGLQLELTLCLEGGDAAAALLFQRADGFQRLPPDDAVVDTTQELRIGAAGLMWRWDKEGRDAVLGFVRYNVLVFMRGSHELLLDTARLIDKALAGRRTTEAYTDVTGLVSVAEVTAKAGARVDLGAPKDREIHQFFIASGGAVNRDANETTRHYYRAGLVPGRYRLIAFHVGAGLLPARQTVPVTIN